ncbi:MAG: hypothetical protein ASARMPRED_006874 [Alectoria sarmentosa]|nr:MAG: hypothetical protein ASARMPRED_006874 [Alectoria sarmentosa]
MASALLSPSLSRPSSPRNEPSPDLVSPDDGYDYNKIDTDPARKATKPRDPPSPVAAPEALQEITATASLEDQDIAYTETLPHIYQRQQGGWNAKVPDLEASKSKGTVPTHGVTAHQPRTQLLNTLSHSNKQSDQPKRVMLRWTMDRNLKNRTLLVHDAKEDVQLQNPDLQRRVFWKFVVIRLPIDFFLGTYLAKYAKAAIKECENQLLSKSEVFLTRRLLKRLRTVAERPFAGGRYLTPLTLRYDSQDVSRYTVDKTCIFFSFPYLAMATPDFREHFSKGDNKHPARTLLQSHYRLNNTTNRDKFQCIRLLKDHEVRSCVNDGDEGDKSSPQAEKTQLLLYVPQFWGIIVGLDTMITSGPLNDRSLLGSAIKIEDRKPPPTGYQLSLVRILFYRQNRLEDLIYPISQCNSWFGLLNKKQQILEILSNEEGAAKSDEDIKRSIADQDNRKPTQKGNLTSNDEGKAHLADKSKLNSRDLGKSSPVDTEKRSPINQGVSKLGDKAQVKSVRYKFWYEDDRSVPVAINININNWALVLSKERHKEVLDIWMRKDVPSITVQSPVDHRSDGQMSFGRSEGGWSSVPPVTKPFLAWPIVDEFGELDPLDLDDRCQRFLRAFHLDLPVPIVMSKEERAKRPKQASAQRVAAKATIPIAGKTLAEARNEIEADGDDAFGIEIFDKFKELLRLFLPDPYGINSESDPIRLYWGSVCVITVRLLLEFPENKLTMPVAQAAGRSVTKNSGFRGFSANLSSIIADAVHLHRGVHCSESRQVPRPGEWREADTIAEGAVLLSAIVEALGAIFRILVESVRSIRSDPDLEKAAMMEPSSVVSQHVKEACKFLRVARDQLIRKADGKDKNDTIGPVVTPEAITITLMRRLVSGVFGSGTLDIINLYEECLEHLALDVKYEASRRLLQQINEFKEEVAIVHNVLKQQDSVLMKLRSSLDPKEFRTPSITRRLRFEYECKDIDEIVKSIREQQQSCSELADRAKLLAIQNVELVETLQDDNSKAIFIFTMVTVLFLPLSFVAGFFGMNVVGIAGQLQGSFGNDQSILHIPYLIFQQQCVRVREATITLSDIM